MSIPGTFFVCLAILVAMAYTGLALLAWLFRRLRRRHPATYEAIGSPSLVWNNSLRNNWLFLKFVLSAKPSKLGDRAVERTVGFIRVFFVVYVIYFLCLVAWFVNIPGRPHPNHP